MKVNLLKSLGKTLRLIIVITMILFIENGSRKIELKVENENLNRTLDLTSMALMVEEENFGDTIAIADTDENVEQIEETESTASSESETINTNANNIDSAIIKTLTGDMTGYSAQCTGCSGVLAAGIDVRNGIVTYSDAQYGNVRIVAASAELPFGSIIKFYLPHLSVDPIYAIVLDRGGAVKGTKLDLLTESNDYARTYIGRRTITYDVLRLGY